MRFLDYVKTAFKNLMRQKMRSFLTIFAIVIGSLSVIIMLSLIIGARNVFYKQLEAMGQLTMVTVSADPDQSNLSGGGNTWGKGDGKKLDDTLVNQLEDIEHVTAISPSTGLPFNKMYLEGSTKKAWTRVIAYDPSAGFDKQMLAGRNLKSGDLAKIVVPTAFLKNYADNPDPSTVIGKKVIFEADGWYTGYGVDGPTLIDCKDGEDCQALQDAQQKKIIPIPVEIVGVSSGMDDSSYVTLDFARQTMIQKNYDNKSCEEDKKKDGSNYQCPQTVTTVDQLEKFGYGSIIMQVDKTDNVAKVGEAAKKFGVSVVTAQEMIDQIMQIFTTVGIILGVIGGISLFVAAIGIINTMIMATYERTREIGVMRACGATKGTVSRLFTFEAAMLGFWGGIFGLLASVVLAQIGNLIANKIAIDQNLPIKDIISFPIWLIVSVISFTTLIGLLAGLYPAHRAARLDPVDALRHE